MKFSVPCGQGLPDGAESRVAQFSEDRDDLGRGGDCSWYAGNAREEPSVAQLHLLLLIFPFHIPWGFGAVCCSHRLDLPLGFVSTGDTPPSMFGDTSLPPAGSVACSIHCDWGQEPAAPPGTSISSFPQESSHVASSLWGVWGGEIALKPAEQCSLVLVCLLHDSSPA